MRHTRTPLLVALVWLSGAGCSCGGIDPPQDGGHQVDAGDAGTLAPQCERDNDCGDQALFCAQWRCRPGQAGADVRGCIDLGPRCDTGLVCDEDTDTCGAPDWCTDGRPGCLHPGDCDGDGERAEECGANDCDDSDPSRYPGAIEICDAHDDDCDPSTLASDDGDVDRDTFTSISCCNPQSDGSTHCGEDCDDADPTRFPGAAERCNALDDDCDGRIDEDFDCAAGESEPGTNACGRLGMRDCDALCTWPDGYFRAEDDTTCDYCADSADGLPAERPFATATDLGDLVHGHHMGSALGTCFGSNCFVDLTGARPGLVGGTFTASAGTLTAPFPVTVGYGDVIVTAEVFAVTTRATPRYGWSIVAYLTDPIGGWLGSESDLGVRRDADGWSAEWLVDGTDRVSLRQLDTAGADPVLDTSITGASLDASGSVTQTMTMTITPDDPATSVDETRVRVLHPCFSPMICGSGITLECANRGTTPCGYTISPGDALTLGVTAGTASGSEVRFTLDSSETRRTALCP